MHTLIPVTTPTEGKELYNVVFLTNDTERRIKQALPYNEAILLVNYLNGGLGCQINKPDMAVYSLFPQ